MSGISIFIKEAPQSSLAPLPCKDAEGALTKYQISQQLDAGLPSSRTARNELILFLSPPGVWHFLIEVTTD